MKITVLDDYQDVARTIADWSPVSARYELDVITSHIDDVDALVSRLQESTVVVAMRERTPFPESTLARLPKLQLLVTTGAKNASIDVAAARRLGVAVCGTGGAGSGVPELTLGMMISVSRHFAEEDASVRAGGWQHTIGPGLRDRTLGVVGFGGLGKPVAKLAQAFGMTVIAWSPNLTPERTAEFGVRCVAKQELFESSDFVTIHLPLADGTRGMIGAAELAAMRRTAYLINTSRGPIVDESALVQALQSRAIGGAALDVYDVEPLPLEHPLRTMPNTLLLPHIGYVTTDAYAVFYRDAIEDIVAFEDGSRLREL